MYFSFFKLKKWGKKTAETRRRNCAVLPKMCFLFSGGVSYGQSWRRFPSFRGRWNAPFRRTFRRRKPEQLFFRFPGTQRRLSHELHTAPESFSGQELFSSASPSAPGKLGHGRRLPSGALYGAAQTAPHEKRLRLPDLRCDSCVPADSFCRRGGKPVRRDKNGN